MTWMVFGYELHVSVLKISQKQRYVHCVSKVFDHMPLYAIKLPLIQAVWRDRGGPSNLKNGDIFYYVLGTLYTIFPKNFNKIDLREEL